MKTKVYYKILTIFFLGGLGFFIVSKVLEDMEADRYFITKQSFMFATSAGNEAGGLHSIDLAFDMVNSLKNRYKNQKISIIGPVFTDKKTVRAGGFSFEVFILYEKESDINLAEKILSEIGRPYESTNSREIRE